MFFILKKHIFGSESRFFQSFLSLTELTVMLAVVWLSGDGLLAVAEPEETRVGRVMSWMPCGMPCCFWISLRSWAWAWAVSWLRRGYWASCCSRVNDSVGTACRYSEKTQRKPAYNSILFKKSKLLLDWLFRNEPHLCDVYRWGEGGRELLRGLLKMEVRGQGEWHHGWLPALCRYCHGGLGGGGDPCIKKEETKTWVVNRLSIQKTWELRSLRNKIRAECIDLQLQIVINKNSKKYK